MSCDGDMLPAESAFSPPDLHLTKIVAEQSTGNAAVVISITAGMSNELIPGSVQSELRSWCLLAQHVRVMEKSFSFEPYSDHCYHHVLPS